MQNPAAKLTAYNKNNTAATFFFFFQITEDLFWAIFQDEATAVFANLLAGKENFQDELF